MNRIDSRPLPGADRRKGHIKHSSLLFSAFALMITTHSCFAQQLMLSSPMDAVPNGMAEPVSTSIVAAPAVGKPGVTPADVRPLLSRWLDLETFSHSERYRDTYVLGGARLWDSAQQRSLIAGKIKLDDEGRYSIGFRASSGQYFNWAFSSYTGESLQSRVTSPAFGASTYSQAQYIGLVKSAYSDPAGYETVAAMRSNGWQFYLRELYFSATPVKPVTVAFGSFGIERGYGSEMTTYDEDGYISGERIALHSPKHLFFDEVQFTNAFFGDFATANFLDRGASLKSFNYRQVSAKKKLNDHLAFSSDYTWLSGTETLREAAVKKTEKLKVIDSIRFEAYERLNTVTLPGGVWPYGVVAPLPVKSGSGFAISLDEKVGRLSGNVGYADVDQDYSVYAGRYFHAVGFALNGDTIGLGKHPFLHAAYQVAPGVSAVGFYTHGLTSQGFDPNRQGWNAGMNFDLKAMVNKEKLVF